MAKERVLTTSEWIAQREADPELLALRRRRANETKKHRAEFARHAAPLLSALAEAGLPIESLNDLKLKRVDYRPQLHILLEWIPRISNLAVKETVIRSLARKQARPEAAPLLINEFLKKPRPKNEKADGRWVIGNSLDVVADDSVFDEMVEIARNRGFGKDRQMIVHGLKNMRNPEAVNVLVGLLDDETVTGHALAALRLMGTTQARSAIEPFVTHTNTFWRNEAKKAIEKFDKIEARKSKGK